MVLLKKGIAILFYLFVLIAVSFFLLPLVFLVVRSILNYFGLGFLGDVGETGSLEISISLVGIFLSIISIIISTVLVYYIQRLSEVKEDHELSKQNRKFYTQTLISLKNTIEGKPDRITITENFISESVSLHGYLDDDQVQILTDIWNMLINIKMLRSASLEDQIFALKRVIYVPFFELIDEKRVKNYLSLLNKDVYRILNKLSNSKKDVHEYGVSFYNDNSPLFESHLVQDEERFKVYFSNQLRYDCSFEGKTPINGFGFEKVDNVYYIGDFKDKKRNGKGELFYISNNNKVMLAKGEWSNGNIINGEVHNVRSTYDSNPQCFKYYFDPGNIDEDVSTLIEVFSAHISDGQITDRFNIQNRRDKSFLKEFNKFTKSLAEMARGKGI